MTAARSNSAVASWQLIACAVWVIGFMAAFLIQPMDGTDLTRADLLLAQADRVLGVADAEQESGDLPPSGLHFLAQRLSVLAGAACLLLLAAAHGKLVLLCCTRTIELRWLERFVLCLGLGLGINSLVVLGCGLLGQMNRLTLVAPGCVSLGLALMLRFRGRSSPAAFTSPGAITRARSARQLLVQHWLPVLACCVIVPFAIWLLLGAISPPTDFDVREYHLQGPKEWFQAGRISYLPHNVYTSFPFLSEMQLLAGMVLMGDWWTGALVGQLVLACFQLLSMLSVMAIAFRWFNREIAWLAALIMLTTPWTLRISLIPYAEGALSFYLTASTMTVLLTRVADARNRTALWFIAGLLAGCAMASKYTGLVTVIVPVGVVLLCALRQLRLSSTDRHSRAGGNPKQSGHDGLRELPGTHDAEHRGTVLPDGPLRSFRLIASFCMGVALMIGPWLLKNLVDTGNPVFPLAYGVFGGDEWSADLNIRWQRAHSADEHRLDQIPRHALDASLRNQWTSGLLFALAIPAILLWRDRRVGIILGICGWQFAAWWAFTHRIDRFWIPVIPLLSLAAASSFSLSSLRRWRQLVLATVAVGVAWNLLFCATSLVGFHAGLMDLNEARQLVIRQDLRMLNQSLPAGSKVLMVGEAEVFDCTFPLVYNTVFDDSVFEAWTSDSGDASLPPAKRGMLAPDAVRAALKTHGITHIYVHWGEILRYRQPGSYGYAEFVQPSRFEQLVQSGVLNPSIPMLLRSWSDVPAPDRSLIESWDGATRLVDANGALTVIELFGVVQ